MVFNLLHTWIIGGNKTKQNQKTLFLYHLSWIGHRTPDYLQWVKLTYSDADNSRIQQPSTIQTTSSAFVPVSQLPRDFHLEGPCAPPVMCPTASFWWKIIHSLLSSFMALPKSWQIHDN